LDEERRLIRGRTSPGIRRREKAVDTAKRTGASAGKELDEMRTAASPQRRFKYDRRCARPADESPPRRRRMPSTDSLSVPDGDTGWTIRPRPINFPNQTWRG